MDREGLLVGLEGLRRENPLAFYRPHAKQDVFHLSRLPLKAFLGGNRSGKTTAGVVDDLIQAVDWDCLPVSERLCDLRRFKRWDPPFFCRIMAPDFVSTVEGVILPKLREWSPRGQLRGGSFDKAYDKARRMLWFENGSWFQFLTYEQDVDKLGGAALHRIHYDEEPPRGHRQESLMRLIDFGGDELFTMTPLLGMTWLFEEVYEPWERGELDEVLVVTVDMDDNPHLDERTKVRVLSGLSLEERQARKQGRFVHFAGLIFGEFDRARHVIPVEEFVWEDGSRHPFPEHSVVYAGIDPGIRHMGAVVWVYLDFDGRMVVFDELALRGSDAVIANLCREIRLREAVHGRRPAWFVIDPAARNRSTQTGRSDQSIFSEHGVATILGQNDVAAGIHRVKQRLQSDKLLFTANCRLTVDQMRLYRWAPNAGKGQDDPPERPVKKDDHLIDGVRYLCMSHPVEPDRPERLEHKEVRRSWLEHDLKQSRRRRSGSPYGGGILS